MLNYIPDDAYAEDFYIAEEAGFHGEFRFTARPLLPDQSSKVSEQAGKLAGEAYVRWVAKFVAPRIRVWSLIDREGALVPITEENLLRIRSRLFHKVIGIVCGFQISDKDPDADLEERCQGAEFLTEANPLAAQLEADRKN